jgi:hypothetical protein
LDAKPTAKKGPGTGTKKTKAAWKGSEFSQIVHTFNDEIAKVGLIDWVANCGQKLQAALKA